jgi:hypothetical protein
MNGMGNGVRMGETSPQLDASAIAAGSPVRDASMQTCPKSGGLNRSMQHWLGVYWPEFQSPRSFAGVD